MSQTLRWVGVGLLSLALGAGCSRRETDDRIASDAAAPASSGAAPASAVVTKESTPPRAPVSNRPLRVTSRFRGAEQARLDEKYATVVFGDGRKMIAPLSSISDGDLAWLQDLEQRHPFTGRSRMQVSDDESLLIRPKQTIVVREVVDGVERVQLCAPAKFRDQLGATCMIYARVHWLDIAGYYVDRSRIYPIINGTPPNEPWRNPKYVEGLTTIEQGFRTPVVTHVKPPGVAPFEWARAELRRGRPLLAAFPREIWQALPPGFVAAHPWNGGSVGHQIVINGFTWNAETGEGTFHIVNSWQELPEFDLTVEAAGGGALVIERSMSPVGEPKNS